MMVHCENSSYIVILMCVNCATTFCATNFSYIYMCLKGKNMNALRSVCSIKQFMNENAINMLSFYTYINSKFYYSCKYPIPNLPLLCYYYVQIYCAQ